jgi:TolB-like protein
MPIGLTGVRTLLEEIVPDAISSDVVEQTPPSTLKVIPAATVRDKKLTGQPAQEVGNTLKVGAVLAGKVTGDGELAVRLIEVDSGALLWANTYNLFFGFNEERGGWWIALQDEDKQDIVRNIMPKLTGKEPVLPKQRVSMANDEEPRAVVRDYIEGKIDWWRVEWDWHALVEPQALLAEAEGRFDTAARYWRKELAVRESRLKLKVVRGCGEDPTPILRGHVAEARCHLAEMARDNRTLAVELPHLAIYYQKKLQIADDLRAAGGYPAVTTPGERYVQQQLRNTLQRLDVVKQRLRPK